ncbi:hypothetical protein OCAR_4321 [Afipia carboxidovorans OM5]|uniref:Uncharacterized protein n=1 Tax=Afipia carboxidovorans (strain ATCC 49405 / DSM 1227 / KCTC 32145 / OM5) TaxID=504832 RepID=B6JAE4_AFIC5|nr:hypothetical protein OCAR_4321 [Afipia carboxidovorans OM5]AEI01360.1 hypothetical protein OCA4_c02040 [Afipia carboxidovorans OM4]AEI04934.1 hypothetical protein OCA5_c02040 [Afipia carboxidovorans OM5]
MSAYFVEAVVRTGTEANPWTRIIDEGRFSNMREAIVLGPHPRKVPSFDENRL